MTLRGHPDLDVGVTLHKVLQTACIPNLNHTTLTKKNNLLFKYKKCVKDSIGRAL